MASEKLRRQAQINACTRKYATRRRNITSCAQAQNQASRAKLKAQTQNSRRKRKLEAEECPYHSGFGRLSLIPEIETASFWTLDSIPGLSNANLNLAVKEWTLPWPKDHAKLFVVSARCTCKLPDSAAQKKAVFVMTVLHRYRREIRGATYIQRNASWRDESYAKKERIECKRARRGNRVKGTKDQ